ncbi:MAG: hypothetical protein H0X24_24070, partial [Ktedonobacterales bacterium]|nr:hypothetical protein [Ktedonobacterales bacterium]
MATTTPANSAAQPDSHEAIAFALTDTPIFTLTRELTDLWAIQSLLQWDQETQMPPAANGVRSEQIGVMESVIHERNTAPALGKAIEAAEAALTATPERFSEADRALVRNTRREFDQRTKLPADFV